MNTNTSPRKLGLLVSLYFSQGLPYGFFLQALPVLLREQQMSLKAIGLTSLLAVPWALKFLWAPVVDGDDTPRPNRRRRWIVPLQLLAAIVMLGAAFIDPKTQLYLLLGCVLLANLLAATQDIATDGLAVDLLDYEERGLGNGVQVAGYRVGMILGGGALLVAYEHIGWTLTFLSLSALLLLATLPIGLYHEPPHEPRQRADDTPRDATPDDEQKPKSDDAKFIQFIKRPGAPAWLVVLCVFKFGEALSGGMLRPFLVDLKLGTGDIGLMLGAAGFTTGLLGALAGGAMVQRFGRWRMLLLFGALQSIGAGVYLLPALGVATQTPALYALTMAEHFTGGLATVALFTMMMDACDEHHGATDYTLQASLVVITTGAAAAMSGFVADAIGYPGHFALAALLSLLGTLAAAALRPYTGTITTPDATANQPR